MRAASSAGSARVCGASRRRLAARACRRGRCDVGGDDEDVGVGFLEDLDFDALLAVDAGDDLAVLVEAADAADVAETDVDVALAADDEGADLLDGAEFVKGADEVFGLALAEGAAGEVDVALLEAGRDLVDIEAEGGEFALFEGDEELFFEAALDLHGGDAGEGLELALHIVLGEVAEFVEGLGAGEADAENRVERRIVVEEERALRAVGQADAVDLFADLLGDEVHVGFPLKFEEDVGLAGFGNGADRDELGDDAELLFEGAGDDVFHLLGRGAGIRRAHGERGVAHVGHECEGESLVGNPAENADGDRDHQDRDGATHHEGEVRIVEAEARARAHAGAGARLRISRETWERRRARGRARVSRSRARARRLRHRGR